MDLFKKELHQRWEELPPVFLTSSEKKLGRDSILDFIERTNAIWHETRENEAQEESAIAPTEDLSQE